MEILEKTITIEELKKIYDSNEYIIELNTPDGYQEIGKWYNKGKLRMITITTPSHETTCAVNHLIQLEDDSWILASELDVGAPIKTISGVEPVLSLIESKEMECFDFEIKHPNHRYYGDGIVSHNSGKSLLSGSIAKNAQAQGIFVVLIDSENALDEKWLHDLGVDTAEDKLLKLNMAMIDDVAKTISEFMKEYKELADKPKILFIIDSLGMLLTPTDVNQFETGLLHKGSMGLKPKALGALLRNCVNMFGSYDIGMICTNHTYTSTDMFDPDDKISGGRLLEYASSIVVAIKKLKLKEDEEGTKTSKVFGIRAACKVTKTRYNKPFETVQIKVPYTTGINPYSGLVDLFSNNGILVKEGKMLSYTSLDGTKTKMFEKYWEENKNNILDLIISEFHEKIKPIQSNLEFVDDEINLDDEIVEEHNESE